MINRIFLSHADTDAALAMVIHDELRRLRSDLSIFVSSMPGAIPTGADWLLEIKRQLKAADAYLTLLTPASLQRQWIWYESGAAFMTDQLFVGVCASGLRKGAVPSPLNGQQLLSFDSPSETAQVFAEFGATVSDPNALWTVVARAAKVAADARSKTDGWIGLQHGDRFFAWDGPLDGLDDKAAFPCPPSLPGLLMAGGMTPTFGNTDRLQHHLGEGRLQVYLTDRAHWKRPVTNDGGQLLLVRPVQDAGRTAFDAARELQSHTEERQRKLTLLHGDVGVRAGSDQFYRLADALDVLVKQLPDLPLGVERFASDNSLSLRYGHEFRLTVQWHLRWGNTLDESRLIVAEWKGRRNQSVSLNDEPLERTVFHLDASGSGEYIWRMETDEPMFFSSVGLADWCVVRLLERVKG